MLVQQTSAEQERQALLAGDVFLGLANGDYGSYLQTGWRDYGSVSAIDVSTGKQVWKFDTPEPERGGPTLTASGVGFVGGGDGNLRAFDAKTGTVLWKFQTGAQIADGPSVYSVNGTEYIAIGVGGTPTSSVGGTVLSQVQVFDLGGSSTQSTAPVITDGLFQAATADSSKRDACVELHPGQGRLCRGQPRCRGEGVHSDRAAREGVGSELLEHAGRPGARAPRRSAGCRSSGEGRRLDRAAADRQLGGVHVSGRYHGCGASPDLGRGCEQGDGRR